MFLFLFFTFSSCKPPLYFLFFLPLPALPTVSSPLPLLPPAPLFLILRPVPFLPSLLPFSLRVHHILFSFSTSSSSVPFSSCSTLSRAASISYQRPKQHLSLSLSSGAKEETSLTTADPNWGPCLDAAPCWGRSESFSSARGHLIYTDSKTHIRTAKGETQFIFLAVVRKQQTTTFI